ncbi:MAG TPA: hypothetical protein VHS28_04740, partial [Chloroflexota bacterium]|nr:hypothetical protein [Chloroflexota bacterium]
RSDSAYMLHHIEQNNLFAAELENGCWRYHHLFRDFLRQQLGGAVGPIRRASQDGGRLLREGGGRF